jgi:hypothetical protein
MKPRRRTVLLSLALLLLAGGALSLPAVHWRLIGWWRGEAFLEGRPTSWWVSEIDTAYVYDHPSSPRFPGHWHVRQPPPGFWESLTGHPALARQERLTEGDVQALPVLLELLRSDQPKARWVAVSGLGALGRRAPEAWPALLAAAQDDADEEVRQAAIHKVRQLDPDAAARAGLAAPEAIQDRGAWADGLGGSEWQMKLNRRRVLLSAGLLFLVFGALALPAVHWRLLGRWRGEAFFQGRPTSYWRGEIAGYVDHPISANYDGPVWFRRQDPSALDRMTGWFGGGPVGTSYFTPPLLCGLPEGLPVLIELLASPEPAARQLACRGLAALGPSARPAEPALRQALSDEDEQVRQEARAAIQDLNQEAADRVAPVDR